MRLCETCPETFNEQTKKLSLLFIVVVVFSLLQKTNYLEDLNS
jgi:hypothetical protein